MKYQIYLNKETSELINKIAQAGAKKPATIIKELVEAFAVLSKPLESKILEEITPGDHAEYLEALTHGLKRK